MDRPSRGRRGVVRDLRPDPAPVSFPAGRRLVYPLFMSSRASATALFRRSSAAA